MIKQIVMTKEEINQLISEYELENGIEIITEEELLDSFLEEYKLINPTILTGWNIDFFDIPYL